MPTTTPNRESTQDRDTDLAHVEALSGADWQIAGQAWEHAASDWAYLFEPYARDGVEAVFDLVGVDSDTRLLDVACGAGSALGRACRLRHGRFHTSFHGTKRVRKQPED